MTGRARRRGRWRRALPGSALALAAALATLAALAGPAAAARAGAGSAAPGSWVVAATAATTTSAASGSAGPGAPAQLAGARIDLVDQTTWLDEGQPFEARVRITRPPAQASVRVTVHERLLSRTAFQEAVAGDLGRTELEVGPVPVAMLPDRGAGTRGAGFATDGSAGAELSQGVYPVAIELLDEAGAPVAGFVTYVVVRPPASPDFPALSVGIVLDIAGPPALQPDGTTEMSDETLDRIEDRIRILDAVPDADVTIAPRPETIDGLASAGTRGQGLLDDLAQARRNRPILARPYVDVDVAALMAAGGIGELNQQADGGANVARTRLGVEPLPGIWLADTTVGEPAAEMLADLGVQRAVVAPEAVADVPGVDAGQAPTGTFRLGDAGPVAMVNDPRLAEHLTGDDGVLGAQRFVAELAMLWLERPADPRGVVVRVPADETLDPALVSTALAEIGESRVLAAVDLDQLFRTVPPVEGDTPPAAAVAPHQPTSDLTAVVRRLDTARVQVGGFDDVTGDVEGGRTLADALLLATGADTPDAERNAYVDRAFDAVRSLADLVSAPQEFRLTLTSRSGEIPLNITNHANQPVTVRIELEGDQLEFPGGDVMTETLQPGGNPIPIPVRVRTSGAFPLNITITSPDGSVILERTRFDIRSTAVSGVGVVLSVGAALFLAVWWARHWRSARRARRLVPPEEIPAVAPPGTPARGMPAVDPERRPPPEAPGGGGGPGSGSPSGSEGRDADDAGAPGRRKRRGRRVLGGPGGRPGPASDDGDDGYRPAHMAGQRPRRLTR